MSDPFKDGNLIILKSVRVQLCLAACRGCYSTDKIPKTISNKDMQVSAYVPVNDIAQWPSTIWRVKKQDGSILLQNAAWGTFLTAWDGGLGDKYIHLLAGQTLKNVGLNSEFVPVKVSGTIYKLAYKTNQNLWIGPITNSPVSDNTLFKNSIILWEQWSSDPNLVYWEVISVDQENCCLGHNSKFSNQSICFKWWKNKTICDSNNGNGDGGGPQKSKIWLVLLLLLVAFFIIIIVIGVAAWYLLRSKH